MGGIVSRDDVLKLIAVLGFLVKRDESFKVKAATISRFVEGLKPRQSFQVHPIEFVPVTSGKFPDRFWEDGVGHRFHFLMATTFEASVEGAFDCLILARESVDEAADADDERRDLLA
jgi:hypothetical protein